VRTSSPWWRRFSAEVIAFLSDHHIEPDIAVEMFVVDALDGAEM